MKIDIQYNLIPSFILGEKLGNQITKKSHRKKCPEGQKNQDPGRDPGTKQVAYSKIRHAPYYLISMNVDIHYIDNQFIHKV